MDFTVAGRSARDLQPIGRIGQVLEIERCAHAEPDHRTPQRTYRRGMRVDSDALDAARMLAEHHLPGLLVTDTSGKPYAVLPASQVLEFIMPRYVRDDPSLAGVLSESMADQAAKSLRGKTVRDVLPDHLLNVPPVDTHDTIIAVAAKMARLRSPLIAVTKDGRLHGVITASRLLAAALKS
jgi:CBS domain-containing protein